VTNNAQNFDAYVKGRHCNGDRGILNLEGTGVREEEQQPDHGMRPHPDIKRE
jgi:hypothetical protein